MKGLPPFTIARWSVYGAATLAAVSVWLGFAAGGTLDFLLLRGVVVFIVFMLIGFAGEAVVSSQGVRLPAERPRKEPPTSGGEAK